MSDIKSDQELAALADWADENAREVPNPTWKRAYALIREGADLLLRRRALVAEEDNNTKPLVKMLSGEPADTQYFFTKKPPQNSGIK